MVKGCKMAQKVTDEREAELARMRQRLERGGAPDDPLLIPHSATVRQNQRPAHLPNGAPAEIPSQVIKKPTKEEISRIESGRTCGNCDCYEYDSGQEEIRRQQFFNRMVKDENWKAEWLANPNAMSLDQFGMCGQSDDMIVPAMSAACAEWRPRRKGLVRSMLGKVKARWDGEV